MSACGVVLRSEQWRGFIMSWVVWVAGWLLRLLLVTLRPVVIQQPILEGLLAADTPFVVTFWHGRMLYMPQFFVQFFRGVRGTVMVSQSRDGELMSQVIKQFGIEPIRGSSSRGGSRAMLQLVRRIRSGYVACITPDGPRGPRYQVQPGVVVVAQKTGAPILPVAYSAKWKKVFPSWDRFVVPLPFSRIAVVCGEPIVVPTDATPEVRRDKQQEVEAGLCQATEIADGYFCARKASKF